MTQASRFTFCAAFRSILAEFANGKDLAGIIGGAHGIASLAIPNKTAFFFASDKKAKAVNLVIDLGIKKALCFICEKVPAALDFVHSLYVVNCIIWEKIVFYHVFILPEDYSPPGIFRINL